MSTSNYGLVTGRVSSIAFDPADPTGNRVYLGTTGGGVWVSQNAATSNASNVVFTPLTDAVGALGVARDSSISIGAITVQPGGTSVVLAGTGDPNDALDSYYGAGILRSADGGTTWSLIQATSDQRWTFTGEGFAGFAWSTVNPQLVVAAVSQAFEGVLTNAVQANASNEGLYYSTDSGATWSLAQITDGNGVDVQGPNDVAAQPDGNAATSVVWNPIRNLFVAAVRYHGYYQSADGVMWTRLTAQPGAGLTSAVCPTNPGEIGSLSCPMFRGILAVNPLTGDTFAWTVDIYNQDQGLWQDKCALTAGVCSNRSYTFGKQWDTSALDTADPNQGPATIENGDYNLALAAIPSGQDTLLAAGANDLWKCSLAAGCAWRNTTNAFTCASAQVAPYQHALAWSAENPLEILIGNDSGLWRSEDAIGESGPVCSADDATHFQNLNGGLGSLAEIASMSQVSTTPETMMVGLGVNGTAGVKGVTGPATEWPQVLGGEGGPVEIDPTNNANWYVNNGAGVAIHLCSQSGDCTPAAFGVTPVVTNSDVNGDGDSMTSPAPFLVDPLDAAQLLIGTCRVWRGQANGRGWTSTNAISPFMGGAWSNSACNGDPLIRTIAAMPLPNGGEAIYAGMYGIANGGGPLAGHVFGATLNPGSSSLPTWQDLTSNPVTNASDAAGMNALGFDISAISIDPHDATGNTIYVTIEGVPEPTKPLQTVYGSTDGGAHWQTLMSNLPLAPANSVVVDPLDANTVYIALDVGVYSTRQIANCAASAGKCWAAYGSGLPEAPVIQLSTAPASSPANVLVAGTYGRGIWEAPLWTAGEQVTTAGVEPASLTFPAQPYGIASNAQTLTVTNTGNNTLAVSSISTTGDFSETDNCQDAEIAANAGCTVQVTFTPAQTGSRMGQLTIDANVPGGQIEVPLSGTGANSNQFVLLPSTVNFGQVEVATTSNPLQVTVQNAMSTGVPVTSLTVNAPFVLATNACGSTVAANSDCQLTVEFAPTQAGAATGTLTMVDSAGTQTVALNGIGAAPPTDTLSPTSLTFPGTIVGLSSAAQTVSLNNSGGMPLTSIAASASGPFQLASNCTTQLVASSSCSIGVLFTPTAVGQQTGTLTISDALRTQTIALSGIGLQPPTLSASPSSLSFPAQQVGAASAPSLLTITNTGGAPLANAGFQVTGVSTASFSVGTATCGAVLNNGNSCTAQVVFTPAIAGNNTAMLIVSSSTLGVKPLQVALSGTGQVAGINVSPAQMTFTVPALGQTSPAQTLTITNTASTSASGVALSANSPFNVAQSSCGASLAAGSSCSAGVVFTPTANGSVSGSLTVASSLNAANVLLTGIGGAAGSVQLHPSVLNFATTGVGAASSVQTVTMTNTGPVAFADLALNASNGFQLSGGTCTAALAPGASCTVGIAFAPTSAGQQTGILTVTGSALPVSPQAVLSGMGFDFAVSVLGLSSQTVSSGLTANYTLVLTALGGSTGTFTFSCGSLPANAACTFNPTSETPAANTTGNAMVQVATSQPASVARTSGTSGLAMAIAFCGLLLLPAAWRRKRKGLVLAAFALIAGGLCGCASIGGGTGGTGSGAQSGGTTSAGTYSIQVKVTSNGVSHGVTLTLTVD